MTKETFELKELALEGKTLYLRNMINKTEAQKMMKPYIDLYNKTAKEKGKKYNVKPKLISFNGLIRSSYF